MGAIRWTITMKIRVALLALLTIAAPVNAETIISGPARVLDGDTIALGAIRVRLHGIDAPEGGQTCELSDGSEWDCGQAATARMIEIIGNQKLECSPVDRDRYGRIVADCFADGINIGEALVRSGLAWAYRHYSLDYVPAEAAAKAARRGIWQGPAIAPWDWRKQRNVRG